MTGRMVPDDKWGTAYVEKIDLEQTVQKFACAVCHSLPAVAFMVNGTITCEDHITND